MTALDIAGEGASSNTVTVVPGPSATAPAAPHGLTASKPKGWNAIALAWSPPASDGGSPIAAYFVYRRGPGQTTYSYLASTSAATRTYSDATVARRTTYAYYATAWNAYGESPSSNVVSIRSR